MKHQALGQIGSNTTWPNYMLQLMIYTSLNSSRYSSVCLSLKPRLLATCYWKIYLQLLGYEFLGNESQPEGGDKFLNHT